MNQLFPVNSQSTVWHDIVRCVYAQFVKLIIEHITVKKYYSYVFPVSFRLFIAAARMSLVTIVSLRLRNGKAIVPGKFVCNRGLLLNKVYTLVQQVRVM
jgi:hypothetical protein